MRLRESEHNEPFWLAAVAFAGGAPSMPRCVSRFGLTPSARNAGPLVEVPLDGAETKSEDYQRDGGSVLLEPQRLL